MRFIFPLAAFLALAVMLGLGLQRNPRDVPSALVQQVAPAIDRPLLEKPEQLLSVQALRGQVWVLNVWASWCAPCRQELPVLQEMSRADQVPVYGRMLTSPGAPGPGYAAPMAPPPPPGYWRRY